MDITDFQEIKITLYGSIMQDKTFPQSRNGLWCASGSTLARNDYISTNKKVSQPSFPSWLWSLIPHDVLVQICHIITCVMFILVAAGFTAVLVVRSGEFCYLLLVII